MNAAPSIALRGLTKRFGNSVAVDGVDLAVPGGAFLVLVGPSGCGKSTILRMLAGLEEPSGGEIAFDGRIVSDGGRGIALPPAKRGIGLVFQSYALWPHMTVAGNVAWPLKVARWPAPRRQKRTGDVLEMLGIGALAARYPGEISGGQQQRVAIARMIAPEPPVLLFDEPLSNLDAKLRVEMRTELLRLHRATGATAVYVTHDQMEALSMASHVAVLRDGRLEQMAPPRELMRAPATAFVATFIGTPPGNLLKVDRADGMLNYGRIPLAHADINGGDRFQLHYRPEDLRLAAEPGPRRIPVRLAEATPMAGRLVVTGLNNGIRLVALADADRAIEVGSDMLMEMPERPASIFDESGRRLA
jgi:iron(III) transport system ATP-binding protein